MDRFAGKYPWLSPYSYTADNPVIFVDMNGDTIDVSHLTKEQLNQYSSMISQMNKSENFQKLYSELQNSEATYTITIGDPEEPRAAAQFKENEPGVVGSGGTFTFRETAMGSFGSIAHEFFHAGQNAIGPDILLSTGREVEAFLFERSVQTQLGVGQYALPNTAFGNAFMHLLLNGFNERDWRRAVNNFLASPFNASGIYTEHGYKPNYYANPLISRFTLW